ncbi:MAG: tetratricopeptide repeat protein [Candidatus Kapabacteria bacterium]|nr:tetratricopeptide repeat protein [Candidatus Kapabacteria bacterium]
MTPEEIHQSIDTLRELLNNSQNSEAKVFAKELIEHSEIHKDQESLSKIYNLLGNVYKNVSDLSIALEYFEKSLKIDEKFENKLGIVSNLSGMSFVYVSLSNYSKALQLLEKSLQISNEIGNKKNIASVLANFGIIYQNLADYSKSIECYEQALLIQEELGNKHSIAINYGNIGNVYTRLSDFSKAIEYYKKAIQTSEEFGITVGLQFYFGNLGSVYSYMNDYSTALEYYYKALSINEKLEDKLGIANNLGNIGSVYKDLLDYPKSLEFQEKSLSINEEIGNKHSIAINLGNIGLVYKMLKDLSKSMDYLKKAYSLSNEIGVKSSTMDILIYISELYEEIGDIENAFSNYKQYIQIKDEIQSEDAKSKAQLFDQRRIIEEDEKARQLKLARFQEQEKILHNILPVNIANRIINQEPFIADHFNSVSVLFMDLVGFTSLSSIAPPKQLVYLLDSIFTKADEVVETFGLEKIKTIGDGYLAVANVTTQLENHQKATALAALQLLETMLDFEVNIPSDLGDMDWIKDMNNIEIRIGIHTGEVVAGIIGKNKYTYDLWGDAVNVASRMESNSEAGRIHVSEQFAKSIEQHSEFSLIHRGEIFIKGKGKMNTYWLEKTH